MVVQRRTAVCNRRSAHDSGWSDALPKSRGASRDTGRHALAETLSFRVNGAPRTVDVEPWTPLLNVLRDTLRLTGTKEGCAVGVCGVCSVLVDGDLVSGCLIPIASVAGRQVLTIEALAAADDEHLSLVQEAFVRHGGFQCGICTPGQVVAATALLRENETPSETQIREWLGGNLCRCTGYQQIVESVEAAASPKGR